ncbi:hypothetical protein OHV05_10130 [Kitasatospora sp. NBC_00070]|uniref:hypothetical protein n=1 Tax=Kitasatospora sp. NBC_00070 TaxID=2975962 RepID=UPI0032563746
MTTTINPKDQATAAAKQAEQEFLAAQRLVTELEERVLGGEDSITHADLTTARSEAQHSALKAEAARRAAALAEDTSRLAACEELRAEIEASAAVTGERLVTLLRSAEQAVRAFIEATDERNTQVKGWARQMKTLGVPKDDSAMPHAKDGRLVARSFGTLHAGTRTVELINANRWLALALSNVRPQDTMTAPYITQPNGGTKSLDEVYALLARVDGSITA